MARRIMGEQPMLLTLNLRVRAPRGAGSGPPAAVERAAAFDPQATALLLCDMWDDHWCRSAARRYDALALRLDPVVRAARARGVQIIHAPSDCMDFYAATPQRRRMLEIAPVAPPRAGPLVAPPLPIDDSDGGCDDGESGPERRVWTRQHAAIGIEEPDVISDNGLEIFSLLRQRGIPTLLIAGVATNRCVLSRSFGIRQMVRWGVPCILVRDLTDALYNPAQFPYVSQAEGTERVIRHIEQFYCPTIASQDLVR
jgi:nicotinamidase-related amidase